MTTDLLSDPVTKEHYNSSHTEGKNTREFNIDNQSKPTIVDDVLVS
jgi:hypothetical protein